MIDDYTFSAYWGGRDDQIFLLSMDEEYRVPNQLNVPYGPGKQLIAFADYGASTDVVVPNALDFSFTNGVLYFAKVFIIYCELIQKLL